MTSEHTPTRGTGTRRPEPVDERERSIANEASAVGMRAGIYAGLAVAVVAAVLGSLIVPLVLILLTGVPTWSAMLWARRRHVDLTDVAGRARLGVRVSVWAVIGTGMLLALGAMCWTIVTGSGLVTPPDLDVVGPQADGIGNSFARGAVVGGMVGVVLAVAATFWPRRRRDDA
ncbi:hypothetical protein [Georgenia sp. Z1491]|uniref:hypothetical protein n=1 Tax=Georgenia sp. Z1491 TaxID=3416707 RepID=UPI003CE93E6F